MRNFIRIFIFLTAMTFSFGSFAHNNTLKITKDSLNLGDCTIRDGDFFATGPCRQVNRLYQKYLSAKLAKDALGQSQESQN